MKLQYPLAALVAAAFVLAGCELTREEARQLTAEERMAITISTVQRQREVQAAIDDLKVYLAKQRAEFVASAQKSLAEMDQKLGALGETIASLQEDAFAEAQFDSLRQQRSQLASLLGDLTESKLESWYDTRRTFDSVLADFWLDYQLVKSIYEN